MSRMNRVNRVLNPVENALRLILETGYTDEAFGTSVFVHERNLWTVAGALRTLANLNEQLELQGVSDLRRLANKLDYDRPLEESDLTLALAAIDALRPVLASLSPRAAQRAMERACG